MIRRADKTTEHTEQTPSGYDSVLVARVGQETYEATISLNMQTLGQSVARVKCLQPSGSRLEHAQRGMAVAAAKEWSDLPQYARTDMERGNLIVPWLQVRTEELLEAVATQPKERRHLSRQEAERLLLD